MSLAPVKIILTGDYYPYHRLEKYCKENEDSHEIFGDLLKELKSSDISGINIEFPITDSKKSIKKTGPNLKGNPITLYPLRKAGFNLAYISNNHTLDYGEKGLIDTINNLKNNRITPIGVGKNIIEARMPYRKKIRNRIISFLNFSENEFNIADRKTGGANPLDIIENVKDIRKEKKNSDFLFVIVHAGQDFNHYPPPFMIKQLRFYAEEGATAIICHHSHYISGYEEFKGVPIFYGLGNVIYPNKVENERQKTLALKFVLIDNRMKYEVIPFYFDPVKMRLFHAGKNSKYEFMNQLESLSNTVQNIELNKRKWFEQLEKREYLRYLVLIGSYPHFLFRFFKKIKCLWILKKILLLKKRNYFQIWNLIRRETHRDALLHIFNGIFKKKEDIE